MTIDGELTHGCDGPLTPFVILDRAIRLARTETGKSFSSDTIANALYEALDKYGWIESDPDAIIETGS